jgi:hypothetical protein
VVLLQLELAFAHGEGSKANNRPVQPLHGRTITLYQASDVTLALFFARAWFVREGSMLAVPFFRIRIGFVLFDLYGHVES